MFRDKFGKDITWIGEDTSRFYCLEVDQAFTLDYSDPACAPFKPVDCQEGVCEG